MFQVNTELTMPPYRQQTFRIRSAQPKDLTQIVAVLLSSFYPQAQATQWLYWLMRLGMREDIKTRLKTPASQYACLVATAVDLTSAQAGKVVGTAEISQRPCEAWRLLPPKRAYISNLAIEVAYRRQGAAQQLLNTSEKIAFSWGFHRVYLHVMADNAAAKALYMQAGYRHCGVGNPILSGLGLRPERLLMSKQIVCK
ncbi:GNAT family N-acetyltransferase [cf. Phormidesmis sp. LEGE 11477]|uniref:GNAT family N-acetyltransferase n=1 Tax=cf. Phormidesmis sp. LEGE 11477 TaxID=1828680 RepID=UPI001A0358EC|nr:GNAT family N-acetyltransferase [cf. Phormidesmis sp. LEGE 11477]MBE9061871.1 GNAT family N-acetyltransferase [cf. Phormidesmis sp. LEGE 11477]